MKKIICLLLIATMALPFIQAQKKIYLSVDAGLTVSGMGDRLANNMKANGFGDEINSSFFFFIFFLNGSSKYPKISNKTGSVKVRYGYNIANRKAIEAGYGISYRTSVKGADAAGNNANYINISCKLSTAYAAYMWKNKKKNTAGGFGPAVSVCNVKQENPGAVSTVLSNKTHVLPGVIFTGYWNFINKKSWFIGLRSDIIFTVPAKVEEVKIVNAQTNSFVSVSKSIAIGSMLNTISISGGIKF